MRYCNTQTVSVYRKTALILKLFPLHSMSIGKIKTHFKQWKLILYFIEKGKRPVPQRPHPSSLSLLVPYPNGILAQG